MHSDQRKSYSNVQLSSLLLNIVLGVLAITTRCNKPIQGRTVERRGSSVPICRYDCLPKKPQRNNNINKPKHQYKQ